MKLKNKILAVSTFFVLVLNLIFKVKAEPNPDFKNNIPVVFGLDENYFYPCVVAMTSLLENANENTFYDIYVIHEKNFSELSKAKLYSLKEDYKNCDINLYSAENQFEGYKCDGYFTKAILYRLEIPKVVKEDKCIYLDSDLVVNEDLSELFNIDIDDYYVAGVRDGTEFNYPCRDYLKKAGMKNLSSYINSGVILWNLKKVRIDNLQPLFYQFVQKHVIEEKTCHFPDQDCINVVCDGKILNLPLRFNAMSVAFSDLEPKKMKYRLRFLKEIGQLENYKSAKENPGIIHYMGPYKPWKCENKIWDDVWWSYAKKTKFADEINEMYNPKRRKVI